MELKDLKLINNGGIPELEQRLEDKVASTAIPLEGSTGKSTLADRKAIHNLPKFVGGKYADDPNAATDTGERTGLQAVTSMVMQNSGTTPSTGNIAQDFSNSLKSAGSTANPGKQLGSVGSSWKPGSSSKFLSTLGSIGGAVGNNLAGAIDFAGGIASAGLFNMTADDVLRDAGTSSGNIGGVGYTRLNDVDSAQISAQTSAENSANTVGLMGKGASLGASIGSVAGPVGGLIGGAVGAIGGLVGGLFGGAARKRKMRRMIAEAKDKAFRQNDYARSGALTSAMQQQYAQEFGDTESQSLYGFSKGKEGAINPLTMATVKNHIVETSHGKDYGPLNSWTEKDEVIWDTKNDPAGLNMHIVDHGPNDGARSFLTDSDAVFSRKGNMNLKALANAGNPIGLQAILNEQADMKQRKNKGLFAAKCGKLPKFVDGFEDIKNNPYYLRQLALSEYADYLTRRPVLANSFKNGKLPGFKWGLPEWTNFGVNAIGTIGSLVDAHNIENEPLSNPNTKKTNPFADIALKTMADIKYNNYQAYNDIWDTHYKYTHQVNNNNNLSAAQRAVMNYTGYKDAMDSMAKINQYAQEANNKYGQAFALMAAQLGEDQANRDQKAAMFDYEAYNQAHGARRLMASLRKADAMNYLNNWAKGLTDMHMWREQMGLWLDDINIRKADLKAKEDALKLNSFDLFGALKGAALGGIGPNAAVGMILGGLGYKPSNIKQSKVIEPVFGSDYAKRMYDALNIINSADSQGVEDTLNSFALDKAANYNSNKPVLKQNTNSYRAKVKNPYTKFTYDQFMKSNSITAKNMRKKWKGDNMNAYYNFLAMTNGQLYHVK